MSKKLHQQNLVQPRRKIIEKHLPGCSPSGPLHWNIKNPLKKLQKKIFLGLENLEVYHKLEIKKTKADKGKEKR